MEDYELCQERAMEVKVCFAIHNVPSPLSGMIQIAAGAVYEEIPYYQCLTLNICEPPNCLLIGAFCCRGIRHETTNKF